MTSLTEDSSLVPLPSQSRPDTSDEVPPITPMEVPGSQSGTVPSCYRSPIPIPCSLTLTPLDDHPDTSNEGPSFQPRRCQIANLALSPRSAHPPSLSFLCSHCPSLPLKVGALCLSFPRLVSLRRRTKGRSRTSKIIYFILVLTT